MRPSFRFHRAHYARRKGVSILLMAMFIIAVYYNGRQVVAAPSTVSTKPNPFLPLLRILRQRNWVALLNLSPKVGSHSTTGLPVAPAGPAGSGGHEGAAGTQRVSIAQHSAPARGSTFPGPQQERWGVVKLLLSCSRAPFCHFITISRLHSRLSKAVGDVTSLLKFIASSSLLQLWCEMCAGAVLPVLWRGRRHVCVHRRLQWIFRGKRDQARGSWLPPPAQRDHCGFRWGDWTCQVNVVVCLWHRAEPALALQKHLSNRLRPVASRGVILPLCGKDKDDRELLHGSIRFSAGQAGGRMSQFLHTFYMCFPPSF